MTGLAPAGASRLTSLAHRANRSRLPAIDERCELCAAPLGEEHPHLLDVGRRAVRCVCRACALLFDRQAAAGGKLRRIPDRRWRFPCLTGDELAWAAFGIPVDLAFFVAESDQTALVTAYYPGPAGITKATVDAQVWTDLVAANPQIGRLEPQVEAMLVRQRRDGRSHFLVPIDDCFRLVGLMRRHWHGFSGGTAVWSELDAFFDDLSRRAKPAPATEAGG